MIVFCIHTVYSEMSIILSIKMRTVKINSYNH